MTFLKKNNINGLSKDFAADGFQVKSVALERFEQKLGSISAWELQSIVNSIALCIGV
jgi:hypothetical protein